MMADRVKQASRAAMIIAVSVLLVSWQQANGTEDRIEADALIFERQQVMSQLDKDAEVLGDIVAGLAPADKLGETTRAIARGAHEAVDAFKLQIPGGHAKAQVWSSNQDFTQRMERFARNADAMAELAKSGNLAAVTSTLADALPCKECHDLYREPKRPPVPLPAMPLPR